MHTNLLGKVAIGLGLGWLANKVVSHAVKRIDQDIVKDMAEARCLGDVERFRNALHEREPKADDDRLVEAWELFGQILSE